jgi:hypothetical protein
VPKDSHEPVACGRLRAWDINMSEVSAWNFCVAQHAKLSHSADGEVREMTFIYGWQDVLLLLLALLFLCLFGYIWISEFLKKKIRQFKARKKP